MRELIDVNARPRGGRHPAPVRDVRYRAPVADQITGRGGGGEMPVEHAVQAPGFVLVPRDAVVYLLGGVAEEVVRLPLHGAESGVQEEKPVVDLVAFARAGRVADFVVHAVVLFDEVLHNRTGFEQPDRLTVGKRVGEGGDAAVGVNGEEKGFLLSVLGYVNFMGLVRKARTRGGKEMASISGILIE